MSPCHELLPTTTGVSPAIRFHDSQDRSKPANAFAPLNVKGSSEVQADQLKDAKGDFTGAKGTREKWAAMKKLVEGLRAGRTKRLAANIARNTVIAANISRKLPTPNSARPGKSPYTSAPFHPHERIASDTIHIAPRFTSNARSLLSPTRTEHSSRINPRRS